MQLLALVVSQSAADSSWGVIQMMMRLAARLEVMARRDTVPLLL